MRDPSEWRFSVVILLAGIFFVLIVISWQLEELVEVVADAP